MSFLHGDQRFILVVTIAVEHGRGCVAKAKDHLPAILTEEVRIESA